MTTFKIGCDPDNFPYTYLESGEWKGFEIEYVRKLFAVADISIEYVKIPWADFFASLRSGVVDAIFSSISATTEREREFVFSKPYFDSPEVLVARPNISISDVLSGRVEIGALQNSNHEKYIRERMPDARPVLAETMSSLISLMQSKQVGCVLMEMNAARYCFPDDLGYPRLGDGIVDREIFGYGSAFAVRSKFFLVN